MVVFSAKMGAGVMEERYNKSVIVLPVTMETDVVSGYKILPRY